MGSTLEVGAVLAETYEVARLLGRGGMGEVWLAKHRRLPGKQVAIKVLHTGGQQLSADALARFRREAEVATRIGHPNIVEVHDFNTLPDGTPYLVLELLQGESLSSRLRHPMELEEAQRILRQVGSALQAAHAHGVIHRDLKPDNVFLVAEPMGTVVKVLDFGISKVVDSGTLQTKEAVLVGTPAYMSPEQALGNNKDVGPQSDVFALGSIAYEMLSGKPPFFSESIAQLVFKIAYEPHPPLALVKSGLPPAVLEAVERALHKDRAQRYPDVASFIADFTGQRLPAVLKRGADVDEPSGVARPGVATPDSIMMGQTAAPSSSGSGSARTASERAPAPIPVAPVTPAASSSSQPLLVVVGLVLALGALFLVMREPPLPPAPAPLAAPLDPPVAKTQKHPRPQAAAAVPVPVAVVLDAGPAIVEAGLDSGVIEAVAVVVDAGGLPEAAPAADAGRRVELAVTEPAVRDAGASKKALALPPPEDREKVKELEELLAARDFEQAALVADATKRQAFSELGESYEAMLATQANCGVKANDVALSRFQRVVHPSHRAAARKFCEEFIDVTMLR